MRKRLVHPHRHNEESQEHERRYLAINQHIHTRDRHKGYPHPHDVVCSRNTAACKEFKEYQSRQQLFYPAAHLVLIAFKAVRLLQDLYVFKIFLHALGYFQLGFSVLLMSFSRYRLAECHCQSRKRKAGCKAQSQLYIHKCEHTQHDDPRSGTAYRFSYLIDQRSLNSTHVVHYCRGQIAEVVP